ncbi:MAG: fasciclin domain-containing protein [Weeksellaceae bacterium]|jgi:uncharacterized surface protein with fasciclin (FAS1) repeats|nr:fasciclin domain-containing protein [Weeksellaceae bacterium]MDX9704990.1 fasciclin domain-containing protein [Weeksellaceae bacterium]
MKNFILPITAVIFSFFSCQDSQNVALDSPIKETQVARGGQETVVDEVSTPDIVKLATSNADLSTLVEAVKAANLATSLSNAGPFTVFAPLNSAFDKLPKETLTSLMKPENSDQLNDILAHHTYVGVIRFDQLKDGQNLGMVDGNSITIKMVNGEPTINGNVNIVASVPAANGIVHVVDTVILPE